MDISLYWLLSKLTMATSFGIDRPHFVRCAASRAAISSL
jgi:hypothetical protein